MISSNTVLAFYDPKYGRLNVSKFAKLKVVVAILNSLSLNFIFVVAKFYFVVANLTSLSLKLNLFSAT